MKTIFYLKDFIKKDFPWWNFNFKDHTEQNDRTIRYDFIKAIYETREFKLYSLNRELKNLIKLVKEKFLK